MRPMTDWLDPSAWESARKMNTDPAAIIIAHVALALAFVLSLGASVRARRRARKGAAPLDAPKGALSTNALFAFYASIAAAFGLGLQVTPCFEGHRAAILFGDYTVLTYLFFFNDWFKNSVALRTFQYMQKG